MSDFSEITIVGTVKKIYESGKGFSVAIEKPGKEKTFTDYVNVWVENSKVSLGDRVRVVGKPSASAYIGNDGKPKGSLGINFPTVSVESSTAGDEAF